MAFDFHSTGSVDDEVSVVFGVMLAFALVISLLVRIALYVLRGVGLYTIAKRRELNRSWLVWIPIAGRWIIGSLSDQYRYLVKGEYRSRRKLLLGLSIGTAVARTAAFCLIMTCVGIYRPSRFLISDGAMAEALMTPVLALAVTVCVLGVVKLLEFILRQLCMLDIYRSCDPGNAVAYLIFAILLSVLEPIFLLAIRKKDGGMPPRRDYAQ